MAGYLWLSDNDAFLLIQVGANVLALYNEQEHATQLMKREAFSQV